HSFDGFGAVLAAVRGRLLRRVRSQQDLAELGHSSNHGLYGGTVHRNRGDRSGTMDFDRFSEKLRGGYTPRSEAERTRPASLYGSRFRRPPPARRGDYLVVPSRAMTKKFSSPIWPPFRASCRSCKWGLSESTRHNGAPAARRPSISSAS